MQDSLDAALSSPSIDCGQANISGGEYGIREESQPLNRQAYLIPPYNHTFGPDTVPIPSRPQGPTAANDPSEYIHRDFHHRVAVAPTTNETSGLLLGPSSTSEYDQDRLAWENFDFGDLDWCLLESFPLENAETHPRVPASFISPEFIRTEPADTASATASTTVVVERSWFAKLENGSAAKTTSSETDQSGPASPGNEGAPRTEINEGYRQSLSSRLRPRLSDEPLPSTEFLVSGRFTQGQFTAFHG